MEMRTVYCTVMGRAFVPRALTLQRSIHRRSPNSQFAFFCADDGTAKLLRLLRPKNSLILAPDAFETPALREIKPSLTQGEYCWTCKSIALLHMLQSDAHLNWAVWVDCDMCAFGDPNLALEAYSDANVLLTPHHFSYEAVAALEPTVGRYNAGYVAVRNTDVGRAALNWWFDRCRESCSATPGDGIFADQKYLEHMPKMFPDVVDSSLAGLNCAPWNVIGQPISVREDDDEGLLVANSPLLIYHFQGLRVMRHWAFDLYPSKEVALPGILRERVYRPYVSALIEQMRGVSSLERNQSFGVDRDFLGLKGWYIGAKQFAWSRNSMLQFS